nr:unnamed protein product [Spirometra erinaceieuropaei]
MLASSSLYWRNQDGHVPATSPPRVATAVHIMVAHSGKTWCRCGTCNQEFCEDDKTLPAKLTIGKEETSEEENQNSNPQQVNPKEEAAAAATEAEASPEDGEAANGEGEAAKPVEESLEPYAATLPILTLCRMLETHEGRHCEQLRPPKRILYLPTKLLQQILHSCGQQAAQVATWLNEAFMQPAHLDVKPFRYEDPNDTKKNKRGPRLDPGVDPLTPDGLECAVTSLQGLMERVGKSLDVDGGGAGEGNEGPGRMGAGTASDAAGIDATSATATGGTSATTQQTGRERNKLPSKLAKLFAQLGERNAIAQAEIEFNETL